MTDRYSHITVVFEKDIREDDAEPILNAIRLLKGVIAVTPNVDNIAVYAGEQRALHKIRSQIQDIVWPEA